MGRRKTEPQKLTAAFARLFRAVLNRSKFIYPIYRRQTKRIGKRLDSESVKASKKTAIRLVTRERRK